MIYPIYNFYMDIRVIALFPGVCRPHPVRQNGFFPERGGALVYPISKTVNWPTLMGWFTILLFNIVVENHHF